MNKSVNESKYVNNSNIATAYSNNRCSSDNKLILPPEIAVVGSGMLKNNLLLESCLQTTVKRWYPWSSLSQRYNHKYTRVSKHNRQVFAGWGNKKSFQRAKKYSDNNLSAYSIEDGFLRSIYSGIDSKHAVSLVADDLGIYFNVHESSRLEHMIVHRISNKIVLNNNSQQTLESWSESYVNYSQDIIEQILHHNLSKYNQTLYCPNLTELANKSNSFDKKNNKHVLVIDQVSGDNSIKGAGASDVDFFKMITDACNHNPDANIWIKAHPASHTGYLTSLNLPKEIQKRVRWITEIVNPIKLLKQVTDVYSVSSHMGFEALLLGKTVHCYGVSWYSGWGLTNDDGLASIPKTLLKKVKKRRQQIMLDVCQINANDTIAKQKLITIEHLFYALYIDYSHYVDPASKKLCNIDTAISWLITNRQWSVFLAGGITVYEFSRWKIPFIKSFIAFQKTTLNFKAKAKFNFAVNETYYVKRPKLSINKPTLVWGLAKKQEVTKLLNVSIDHKSSIINIINQGVKKLANNPSSKIYCMEDGFIRSNGLGATLLAPLSVVLDTQGIYYNATEASDLESLLKACPTLTTKQLTRIHLLSQTLLANKVSKYNVGTKLDEETGSWVRDAHITKKRKILIVGQVEDDLSVQYCGSLIKTNTDLLERVVKDCSDAFLIYKPHPDVEAGLRTGKVSKKILARVDAVARDISMPDCLDFVDEIHTISSLTGFEGLLRNKKISCYGLPFYAGWGLTIDIDSDKYPKAEYLRRRQYGEDSKIIPLTLEQLIHCTLIEYPLYRLPNGYGLAQVEQVIEYLYIHTTIDKDKPSKKMSLVIQHGKKNAMKLRHKYLKKQ